MLDIHDPRIFESIAALEKSDFEGFEQLNAFKSCKALPGVYFVLRDVGLGNPKFLEKGTGGFYKGEDPNVSLEKLSDNWIDNVPVLYIGQSTNVHRRIKQLVSFGSGKAAPHRGGKMLWQIADSNKFKICWRYCAQNERPRECEKHFLQLFCNRYGRLPFANCSL